MRNFAEQKEKRKLNCEERSKRATKIHSPRLKLLSPPVSASISPYFSFCCRTLAHTFESRTHKNFFLFIPPAYDILTSLATQNNLFVLEDGGGGGEKERRK
jgi:hypothetical protein